MIIIVFSNKPLNALKKFQETFKQNAEISFQSSSQDQDHGNQTGEDYEDSPKVYEAPNEIHIENDVPIISDQNDYDKESPIDQIDQEQKNDEGFEIELGGIENEQDNKEQEYSKVL